jgi:hypothetical protein
VIWLYLRFTLSYREIEELLAERGLDCSCDTVRCWVLEVRPSSNKGPISLFVARTSLIVARISLIARVEFPDLRHREFPHKTGLSLGLSTLRRASCVTELS